MFKLKFDTDNAAFYDALGLQQRETIKDLSKRNNQAKYAEIERILKVICLRIYNQNDHGEVRDVNGNKIGEWKIT